MEKKIDMHDFPENNSRGEFMQCPYVSSFVGQCKCPSLSRNTFATKVTSTFRRNSVILKYIKVKLLLYKLSLKRGFKFSIVMYCLYISIKAAATKKLTLKKYNLKTNNQKHVLEVASVSENLTSLPYRRQ